jgi:hypothetical protein
MTSVEKRLGRVLAELPAWKLRQLEQPHASPERPVGPPDGAFSFLPPEWRSHVNRVLGRRAGEGTQGPNPARTSTTSVCT